MSKLWCCLNVEDEERKNVTLQRSMSKERRHLKRQVKILLLGSGESGKSTFIKQMTLIHGGGQFSDEEVKQYQKQIYQNVITGMRVLISAKEKLGIDWSEEKNEKYVDSIVRIATGDIERLLTTNKFIDLVPKIKKLWLDQGIKETYDQRNRFQLTESCKYFFEEIDRLAAKDYLPTNQDILYCRKASRGITEHCFDINKVPFRFIDVGGQRSQRQKWFQCFEDITCMLFMVGSSEYDQVIYEDRRTNRVVESRSIFETVTNNKCFEDTAVILFMNKTDILTEKLPHSDIRKYFADFKGDHLNLKDVQLFMVDKFEKSRKNRTKPFFYHFTTAVDTNNIRKVFTDARQTILELNIEELMMN
uniref:Guanine nucleotide-binding protein subunit alpha-12 n=1 Tax=Rhabditophanes sp. KR3021 TaxID=114890 RepID=A0AC35U656_9BILA